MLRAFVPIYLYNVNIWKGFTPTAPLRSPSPNFDLIWSNSEATLGLSRGHLSVRTLGVGATVLRRLPESLNSRLILGLFTEKDLYAIIKNSNKDETMEFLDAIGLDKSWLWFDHRPSEQLHLDRFMHL